MSWLTDWFKYKVCLTRVIIRDDSYTAQARYAFFWYALARTVKCEYDSEADALNLATVRTVAAEYARDHRGYYEGTIYYKPLRMKIRRWIQNNLSGPQGLPGAPGMCGPTGLMGPAYDDIKCPHCERRHSYAHPKVKLHFDCYGEDAPLVYTCPHSRCRKQSNWIAYNGIFLNAGTITQHDPSDYKGNEAA